MKMGWGWKVLLFFCGSRLKLNCTSSFGKFFYHHSDVWYMSWSCQILVERWEERRYESNHCRFHSLPLCHNQYPQRLDEFLNFELSLWANISKKPLVCRPQIRQKHYFLFCNININHVVWSLQPAAASNRKLSVDLQVTLNREVSGSP